LDAPDVDLIAPSGMQHYCWLETYNEDLAGRAAYQGAAEHLLAGGCMRKKLSLDLDAISVDSFATAEAKGAPRGTVEAHAPCTCRDSCVCPSAIYWCAEVADTVYSCDYTINASCWTS